MLRLFPGTKANKNYVQALQEIKGLGNVSDEDAKQQLASLNDTEITELLNSIIVSNQDFKKKWEDAAKQFLRGKGKTEAQIEQLIKGKTTAELQNIAYKGSGDYAEQAIVDVIVDVE